MRTVEAIGRLDEVVNNVSTEAKFVPLSGTRAQLGESPVWSVFYQAVWWVDITGRRLFQTKLTGETQEWETPEMPGFVQVIGEDVFVGMQTGIFRFDPVAEQFEKRVALLAPNQRFNDACCDTHGRIWAGTMDIENQRANGTLYLFDPAHRTLLSKFEGFRTINGLAWDNPNARLFFSDSHPEVQTVWTCDVTKSGRMSERVPFARFHDLNGRPDGAALDRDGNYWIAGVGGGAIYRFTPNGAAVTQFNVPVQSPTKPAIVDTSDHPMVLTSFDDGGTGGRLVIWPDAPARPIQESNIL